MARYLTLDWDYQQLFVVAGTVKHGVARIERAMVWQDERTPNPAEAAALGPRLRERLKAAGIAPAPVLVCVGRDRVILKEIRYPAVAAAEEAAVVRFQAIKELTHAAEEVVIDYLTVDEGSAGGDRRALAVILRRELLDTYRTLCRTAGLKLAGITPRPFGTAACLRHQERAGGATGHAQAILTGTERWAEFCVVRGGQLMLARSLSAAGPNAALLGEIRRNLTVYAGQAPQHPVRALHVTGGEPDLLRDQLRDSLAIPVHGLDPLAGLEPSQLPAGPRGPFAGGVGLLHALAERRELPINLAKPREPRPPSNRARRWALAAVAAALLLLTGGAFWAYSRLADYDRELERLTLVKLDLDRQLIPLEEDARRLKALGDWTDTQIVWLDELYDLTHNFPEPVSVRLTHMTGDPLPRNTGKEKHVARMTMKGLNTDDHKPVDALMARLVEDAHYRVEPKVLSRNPGMDRFRFTQQFTTRVDIAKQPPSKYVRVLKVAPPAPERRGDMDLFDFGLGGQP